MAEILSAQVVLKPADKNVDANEPITAANLARHAPSEDAVTRLQEYFRSRGFTVDPLTGISFAITGPAELFRSTLRVGRETRARRSGQRGQKDELPTRALPEDLRQHVMAVTFTPAPEFGPGAP